MKLRLLLSLALLSLAGCIGNPSRHLEKARELTYERKPQEALKEYDEVLLLLVRKDSASAQAQRVEALKGAGDLCYLELKRYPKAAEYYRNLAERYPEDPQTLEARANLADIFRTHFRDRRAAVAQLTAIVQSFPKSPEVDRFQYLAAKDYFELGDYQQSMVEATALQTKYPQSPYADDAQMLIAASLSFLGQTARSEEAYEELGRKWPASDLVPHALFDEARLLSDGGSYDAAIEVLVRSLKTHPDPQRVQSEIARLRGKLEALRAPARHQHTVWSEGPGHAD